MPTLDLELDLARASVPQLHEQRQALLATLDAPPADADLDALTSRATSIAEAITKANARETARAALASMTVTQRPAGPDGERDRSDADIPDHHRVITSAVAARAVIEAPATQNYGGGKVRVASVPGMTRATFTTSDYPSEKTRVPGILDPTPDTPLTILDLIDSQPMASQTIEWVQENGDTTGAAEVAEGSPKPESTLGFSLETTSASTIAHWVNITRQTLQDEAMLEGYVRGRLSRGLFRRANAQVLSGDGIAPNIEGIENVSGIGTYTAPAAEDPLISVRKAKTVAQLSEYAPDAVAMNPVDWETIELSTDSQGQFRTVANVAQGAQPRLWGLVVVSSTNLAGTTGIASGGGTFLVGGFREGATFWQRTGVDFYLTDSHASNFTSNILTLLAEIRAALTVWRPLAFVVGTFDDGV